MNAFFDESRPSEDRGNALRALGRVGSQLAGTLWIPRLIKYADKCNSRDLKLALVQLVASSYDPRGLPLLSSTLSQERDWEFEFSAAGPLAAWNIRDGVRTLLKLLDSEVMLSERQPLWWAVLRGLEDLNDVKGWGFPTAQVREEIETIEDWGKRMTVYRQRWKEWFAENEQQFPDWKPVDPLPRPAELDPRNSTKE
jgi:hypothetical protein